MPASKKSWNSIFKKYFLKHDFNKKPAVLTADMIKDATRGFRETRDREVRILAKIDERADLPQVMADRGLFVLPTKNGEYILIKGEGFHDVEPIKGRPEVFKSKLTFELKSAKIGGSEMQHLDFAFNTGLIHHFSEIDKDLYLQIRGRKYTPEFNFKVNKFDVHVKSVQTEVDAGYEGKNVILLFEAKSPRATNFIIRQLYYPFRQWKIQTGKNVVPIFFAHNHKDGAYSFWKYKFEDENDYNSIKLVKSGKYKILE